MQRLPARTAALLLVVGQCISGVSRMLSAMNVERRSDGGDAIAQCMNATALSDVERNDVCI